MAIILFDGNAHRTLLPLTYTRPVADLRIGILTIAEKWGKHLKQDFSFHTQPYLQVKYPVKIEMDNLFINGAFCPDEKLVEAIEALKIGESLSYQGQLIAVRLNEVDAKAFDFKKEYDGNTYDHVQIVLRYPEDIFKKNDAELRKD